MNFEKFKSLGESERHEYIKNSFPANPQSLSQRRPLYGVAINDAEYMSSPNIGGNMVRDPCYSAWKSLIVRCNSEKYQSKRESYIGCTVSGEWLRFSMFQKWWEDNQVDGWHLDKDVINYGNKNYGPKQCVFVPPMVNNFVLDSAAARGQWPIGVSWDSRRNAFSSNCRNPISGKLEFLGCFPSAEEAHEKWRVRKMQLIPILCEKFLEMDSRVEAALINRYEKNR